MGTSKIRFFIFLSLIVTLSAFFAILAGNSPEAAESGFTPAQKEELGSIVRDYLIENPEAVIEALNAYQQNQQQVEQRMFEKTFAEKRDEITGGFSPAAGNPDADITIVEFFDYNCGYCKRALEDVIALLDEDKKIKVVFKDLPILSESSRTAARWALAAAKQDKYFDYHVALMNHKGGYNEQSLAKIGGDLGLDVDRLRRDAEGDKEIRDTLEKNLALSRALGIQGTPAFIIGDKLAPGYMGKENMKATIAAMRMSDQ